MTTEQNGIRKRKRRRGGGSMSRLAGILTFLPLAGRAPLYARLIWALLLDPDGFVAEGTGEVVYAPFSGRLTTGRTSIVPSCAAGTRAAQSIASSSESASIR